MKKLLLILTTLFFASCEKGNFIGGAELEWWERGFEIVCIFVENEAGENLLDPTTEGYILENDIKLVYKENIYELPPLTRAVNFVHWSGFIRLKDLSSGIVDALGFGGFGWKSGFHKEKIEIDWGDGTTDTIWFDCYINWVSEDNPEIVLRLWLKTPEEPDGKLVDDDGLTVTIIK